MTKDDWVTEILQCIKDEPQTPPDRSGETPILRMARRLRRVEISSQDASNSLDAIKKLILKSEETETAFWFNLCRLIGYARFNLDYEIKPLIHSLKTRFHENEGRLNIRSRAAIMSRMSQLGYIWCPDDVQKEEDILKDYPMQWIEAALTYSNIDNTNVTKAFKYGLSSGRLRVSVILPYFPSWLQTYKSALVQQCCEWLHFCPEKADKDNLKEWFRNRGIEIKEISHDRQGEITFSSDRASNDDLYDGFRDKISQQASRKIKYLSF